MFRADSLPLFEGTSENFRREIMARMQMTGAPAVSFGEGSAVDPGAADFADSSFIDGSCAPGMGKRVTLEEDYDIRADFGDIIRHGLYSVNIFSVLLLLGGAAATAGAVVQVMQNPGLVKSLLGAAAGILVAASIVFSALLMQGDFFCRAVSGHAFKALPHAFKALPFVASLSERSASLGRFFCFFFPLLFFSMKKKTPFHPPEGQKNKRLCGKNGISMVFFMLTDILEESSEILCYGEGSGRLVEESFEVKEKDGGYMLPGVVSRKKQLIPAFIGTLQQNNN